MENTIDIKNWKTGEVLFSYTCEDNTIGKTVEEAVKQGVSLACANLGYSDLSNLNLSNANLSYSRLVKSNLSNSNLDFSDLSNAILDNVKGLNNQCPKEGSFIGWKKCHSSIAGPVIVKLEIPADAKRSSSTTMKCRCDKAKVLDIQKFNGTKAYVNEARSYFNGYFKYRIGEMRQILDFDERYWIECARGIHFFMNREDAVKFEI